MLKLRAHIDNISPDNLLTFLIKLAEKCDKLLIYRHPKEEAEREHIHGLLVGCTISEKQVRERLNKDLNLDKSNKNYSVGSTYGKGIKMSELTMYTYISYMSKGEHQPLYNKGFDLTEVENCRMNFHKKGDKTIVKYEIEKITPVKKLTQFQISNEAEIRYLEQYKDDDINWFEMYNIVKQVCRDNKVCSHDNTVAYILQDIQSRLKPEEQWKRIRNRI